MVCVTRLEFDKLHSIERIELLLPLLLECLARFNRPGDGWGRVLVVGGEHFRNPGPLLLQFVRGTVTYIHVGLPGLHIRHEILLLDSALGSETGNHSPVVVLDLMIHDVDLILSFGLGQVNTVEAVGIAVLSPQVDFAHARVEFDKGCVVNFTASRMSTGRLRKMRLFQERLYLSVDFLSRQGIVYRQTEPATVEAFVQEEAIQAGDEEPLKRELQAFVQAMQTGAPGGVSGEEGVAALELVHAIIHSIRGTTHPLTGVSKVTP